MPFGPFHWLFPSSKYTEGQLQVFKTLSDQPMTVPNVNLQSILELKLSNNASSPTKGAHHYFYLRSWVFTLDELETFLSYMTEEDSIIEEIMRWNDVVAQQ